VISQIDARLGPDEERPMYHATRICESILGRRSTYGGSLVEFAAGELSGSGTLTLAEAERAVEAIRVWCRE
jgi:hypothetical protein